jgi:lipoprotein-anchoring transpeptidase ErfK/SrfK
MSARHRVIGAALLLTLSLSACDAAESLDGVTGGSGSDETEQAAPVVPVKITASAADLGAVQIAKPLRIDLVDGTLKTVTLTASDGTKLDGERNGSAWTLTSRLEPGTDYVARARAERSDGEAVTKVLRFHTEDLTLDQQAYPSVAPLAGETVGVGMPVVVSFDLPVADKAAFERHMTVTSTPAQAGAWHWFSDKQVRFRPKTYWQAGTDVSVNLDLNSIPAGNGIYGQESRVIDFHVGDANVYKVSAQTHQMQVFTNGELIRTIPITTGKAGFTTRSGTKVISEKFEVKRMNSETVGISSTDPEAYDIDDVQWAMRLTDTGEFIHAAPWSVGSQGYANVSHGCTGMSTENAAWLYARTKRGDVVEYTGTDRWMTLANGYGDWNADFATYRSGSALS